MRLLAFCLAAAFAAAPAFGQSAEGLWRTQPSEAGAYLHVRIAPCGAALCGDIEEAVGAMRTDLVGRRIIAEMTASRPGAWSGGTIWAPDDNRTYRAKMSLQGADLKVEGCILVVCRGQVWSRLE